MSMYMWSVSSLARQVRYCVASAMLVLATVSYAESPGDPAAGESLYRVCGVCHGNAGQGNQAMNGPKLAGQEAWYLKKQMQLFISGARGTAPGDLQGGQMAAMARGPQLQTPTALDDLFAYVGTFADEPAPKTVTGDAEKGAVLYRTCLACHGDRGQGLEALAGPRLAGQNDWYLVSQLQKFKKKQRGYDVSDHGGRQMQPMSLVLPDEQAILDVVAYINTLE